MASQTIGVYAETAPGERRVALVPEMVRPIRDLGLKVVVEPGAGRRAHFLDGWYADAGASVVCRSEVFDAADILLGVRLPNVAPAHRFRTGQALICLLQPLRLPQLIRRWAGQGLTTIGADLVPCGLSHARPMDALTFQAQIAGYQAVLTAADVSGRCLPASVPASGTGEAARILVIGQGPTGWQATATAREMGAQVRVLAGHVRAQTQIDAAIPDTDIVIATADNVGLRPPMLVSTDAIRAMRPGSVIVDTTASAFGSVVEAAEPYATIVVEPGVTVVGDDHLAAKTPTSASIAYATSITALLRHMVRGGVLSIDLADPVQAATVVTHHRDIPNDAVWQQILAEMTLAGLP